MPSSSWPTGTSSTTSSNRRPTPCSTRSSRSATDVWSIALKSLRANISRFVATLIAIGVGVGFLTASLMVTNSIQNSLGGEIDHQYAGIDAVMELAKSDNGPFSGLTNQGIPPDQLETVQKVDGVAAAAGVVDGLTKFVTPV